MTPIDSALAEIKSLNPGERVNYTKIAKKHGIDRNTLSRRHRGIQASRQTQYENLQLLNNQQEKQLLKWINDLTDRGLPPSHEMLRNFVKEIVGVKPGKHWPIRFLKRYSRDLISRYTTAMDNSRKKADSAYKYSLYFDLLGRKIDQYKIDPEQIYNMDEKGFMIGILSKSKRIFSRLKYEQGGFKQQIQDGNREWITTIACICADGTALSPGLIYQAVSGNIQDSWLQDFDSTKQNCFFASSPSGWTNDDLGYAWLTQIFDSETKTKARTKWRLLILDGHGSHVTMKFINYCDANKILLALYPPHSTHSLQPLDVSLFGPLSRAYSEELEQFLHDAQGFTHLAKRDFFRLFWNSWNTAFTVKNINSGWKTVGIHPWNPEIVLIRFTTKSDNRPSSSDSTGSILSAKDWSRIRTLLKEVTNDICDKKVQKLNNSIIRLSTENALLKIQNNGLKVALGHEKQKRIRGNPLPLEIRASEDGNAIFYSPNKIQRARELLIEKEEAIQRSKTIKEEEKLRRQQEKEEKQRLVEERKAMRALAKEERIQKQEQKRRQKEKANTMEQANLQPQNDIQQIDRDQENGEMLQTTKKKDDIGDIDIVDVEEVLITVNRRGRQIRLPQRFRD